MNAAFTEEDVSTDRASTAVDPGSSAVNALTRKRKAKARTKHFKERCYK